MFDYAVVGLGLIGSAAAKYLSQTNQKVVAIGPGEPGEPWANHDGVFASHYDQGRITRQLDGSPLWADMAIKSIAKYDTIEKQSGVKFYHQAGCMHVGQAGNEADNHIAQMEKVAHRLNASFNRYSAADFREIMPQLHFDDVYTVLYEPTIAGYINPRQLVEAQLIIAAQHQAKILRETAVSITTQSNHIQIKTEKGTEVQAKKVLVAAGGWTHFLLGTDLGLIPKPRTILLAELSEQEATRLKNTPSIIYSGEMIHPTIDGFYSLPPIRYPDGNIYLKIGTGLKELPVVHTADELNAWFHGEGSQVEADGLKEELYKFVKELKAESHHVKPCVTTYTASREPLWAELEANLFVVAGGCGAAAKSSNEIGRRAAEMVLQ